MVVLNTCRLMGCESCDQTEGQVEVSNDKRERQTDRGKKNKRERQREEAQWVWHHDTVPWLVEKQCKILFCEAYHIILSLAMRGMLLVIQGSILSGSRDMPSNTVLFYDLSFEN